MNAALQRRARLRRYEYLVAIAGFGLLADAAGWELAAAFLLITWAGNLRAKRYRT